MFFTIPSRSCLKSNPNLRFSKGEIAEGLAAATHSANLKPEGDMVSEVDASVGGFGGAQLWWMLIRSYGRCLVVICGHRHVGSCRGPWLPVLRSSNRQVGVKALVLF